MLVLGTKSLVPSMSHSILILLAVFDHKAFTNNVPTDAVSDIAERPAMLELHRTYGKTTHTWQFDVHPDLPLGPPQLMMAYTDDSQVDRQALKERDEALGVSTEAKREVRKGYLKKEDLDRPLAEGADCCWEEGKLGQWEYVEQ